MVQKEKVEIAGQISIAAKKKQRVNDPKFWSWSPNKPCITFIFHFFRHYIRITYSYFDKLKKLDYVFNTFDFA